MKMMKFIAHVCSRSGVVALCLFLFFIGMAGLFVYAQARADEAVSLNEAVRSGQVRVVQSKSPGGYSRFRMELENTSNRPVSVDPYGSAFDPPRGVGTQRVGIGLPTRIGDRRVDMRGNLSTDPSREAPVGAQAAHDGTESFPPAAGAAAAGAAAATAALGALLTGMAQGVSPREAISDIASLVGGDHQMTPPDTQDTAGHNYQIDLIKSYRDQDMTELDYQKQRLDAAKAQGADDVVRDAQAAVDRLSRQISTYDQNLAELGHKPLEHTELERRSFDFTREDLGADLTEARRKLDDFRETAKYVDWSNRLAEQFGTNEEKEWCRDFIASHAKLGPDGYEIDSETARQIYSGLKKQMYESGQILNEAEYDYQMARAEEIERKTEVVTQIRDNTARINRILAKIEPTGTVGGRIVDIQYGAYGAIAGYEEGGIAGAAESVMLTVADSYSEGFASGNYNALKDAYAEHGLSDISVTERLVWANLETVNNKYNFLDHAGKSASSLLDGEYGAAFDSAVDAYDAGEALKDHSGKARDWYTGANADTTDAPSAPETDTEK